MRLLNHVPVPLHLQAPAALNQHVLHTRTAALQASQQAAQEPSSPRLLRLFSDAHFRAHKAKKVISLLLLTLLRECVLRLQINEPQPQYDHAIVESLVRLQQSDVVHLCHVGIVNSLLVSLRQTVQRVACQLYNHRRKHASHRLGLLYACRHWKNSLLTNQVGLLTSSI